MLSLLNNVINHENKTNIYIAKLRSKNIKVLPPDINFSENNYIIKNDEIICPLSIIRNVGTTVTNIIIKERTNGLFTSFIDFAKRIYSQSVNRKVLESLILSGAFNTFGYNKNTLINNLDNIINYVELSKDAGLITIEEPLIDELNEYSKEELIQIEFDIFGFYLSSHPVSKYKENINMNTLALEDNLNRFVELVVEVNFIKEILTKNNDVMAFLKVSDEYKQIDITLFPKLYKECQNLKKYDIIKVTGKVEKRFDDYQIIATNLINLSNKE